MAKELKIVKRHKKNGSCLFDNGMIRTPIARLAFVNLSSPRESQEEGGKPKYGVTLLFSKGEDLTLLREAFEKQKKEEWGSKPPKKLRTPFRDQGEKSDEYEGFEEGAIFMNVTSVYKPPCVNGKVESIDPDQIYSGCYARVTLRPYAYDNKGNAGVGFGLQNVQFIRDGEPLGGGVDPSSTYDNEDEDGDTDNDLV